MAADATGDWRQYVTSDTLQAADLKGQHLVVVIAKVVQATMTDRKDAKLQKGVLNVYFQGKKKPLVVKAELSGALTKLCGSNKCKDWIGQAIEIYPTQVWAFGANHDVVRISPKRPAAASAKSAASAPAEPEPPPHDMVEDEVREIPSADEQRAIAEQLKRENPGG